MERCIEIKDKDTFVQCLEDIQGLEVEKHILLLACANWEKRQHCWQKKLISNNPVKTIHPLLKKSEESEEHGS